MIDMLAVIAIVCMAAVYAAYKVFVRPSCGCGNSAVATAGNNGGCGGSCGCGKHTDLKNAGGCGGGTSCVCKK